MKYFSNEKLLWQLYMVIFLAIVSLASSFYFFIQPTTDKFKTPEVNLVIDIIKIDNNVSNTLQETILNGLNSMFLHIS